MKYVSGTVVPLILLATAVFSQTLPDKEVIQKYQPEFEKLLQLRQKVAPIHPSLWQVYPVAIAENKKLYIFDYSGFAGGFTHIKTIPEPFPLRKGIRASFPLEALGNKPCCIVSGDVFNSTEGLITIFHEFVHCYQWDKCEMKIKNKLYVYIYAMNIKNYMWELNHKFPYKDKIFTGLYTMLLKALKLNDLYGVQQIRHKLQAYLSRHNYEYMVWQEWKEGFARYLENRMRAALSIPENTGGTNPPYSRVSFYAGGDYFFRFMHKRKLDSPIDTMFYKLYNITF